MVTDLASRVNSLESKSNKVWAGIGAIGLIGILLAGLGIKVQYDLKGTLEQVEEAKAQAVKAQGLAEEAIRKANSASDKLKAEYPKLEEFLHEKKSDAVISIKEATSDLIRDLNERTRSMYPIRIDCPISEELRELERDNENFENELYTCSVDIPMPGILYLSLQGHVRSKTGKSCSYGIFFNGNSINTAARENPSHKETKAWSPAFMADTVIVESGTAIISLRMKGERCAIHDADINGIFLPTGITNG